MAWLTSPERFFKASQSRFAFLVIGIAAFVATELIRFKVGPYVQVHGIDDFGLAENIFNLGGIIVMIFLGCAALNPTQQQSFRLAAFFSIGFIVYQVAQQILQAGVFDWNDVYATGIGYVISVITLFGIWPFVSEK